MTFLTITSQTWYMAGISVGVVFSILLILVLVLKLFSFVAEEVAEHSHHAHPHPVLPAGDHADEANDEHLAVVATAIYLYLNSGHDEESGILTINNRPTEWHAVLNPKL